MPNGDPHIETCSLAEYEYYLEERVIEAELSVQGLYLFMSKSVYGAEAVRCPARIERYAAVDDLLIVKFSLLSQALKPALFFEGSMLDGILLGDGTINNLVDSSYFRLSGLIDANQESRFRVGENVERLIPSQQPDRVLVAA